MIPETPRQRRNRLRKIKLAELSLVNRGANQLAHVVLTKHAPDGVLLFDAVLPLLSDDPTPAQDDRC